jgi:hypothetical protein
LPVSTGTVEQVRRPLPHALLTLFLGLLVAVLVVPVGPAASGASASAVRDPDVHPEWGSTSAPDAKVRRSCHEYAYAYTISPPSGDWALETFLVGPRDKAVGSGYFLTGKDPLSGTSTWRLCRHSLKGGVYTIRALLTVQNGSEVVEGWLPDSTFRLTKKR